MDKAVERGFSLDLGRARPVLDDLVARLREAIPDDLLAVALYGSTARGEGRTESDLDVLIIVREGRRQAAFKGVGQALREVEQGPFMGALRKDGFLGGISPLEMDEARCRRHPWILLDVVDHGVLLHDPHGFLARELQAMRGRMSELGSRKVGLADGSWYWDLKPDWKPGEVFDL